MEKRNTPNDFSKGKVWRIILAQAIPLTLASFVQLLYNVVDRVYIGHLRGTGGMALTGVGVTFPIVTFILALTMLFASGGSPLFSMARGAGDGKLRGRSSGNRFSICSVPPLPVIPSPGHISPFTCWGRCSICFPRA